jgi:putative DNA primase/helicase
MNLERFDFEPWDHAVDGSALLSDISNHLSSVVVLPHYADFATALWLIHTYLIEPADADQVINTSPILLVNSPDRQCGKSTIKKLLSTLAPRPVLVDNISQAALYRYIELEQPTLLIDEADTFLTGKPELIGILNSGYKPDGHVIRQGGVNYQDPIKFSTWSAKAIFGIGDMPDTLFSRCICIPMKRKKSSEKVERLNVYLRQHSDELTTLKRRILRFCLDNKEQIGKVVPDLPYELDDRQQDNWEPLLQIAHVCGSDWISLANQAAISLSPKNLHDETNLAEMLLADIEQIFQAKGVDRIKSNELVRDLTLDATKPWGDFRRGRPMIEIDLARLLKRYGIGPIDIRFEGRIHKGYFRADFEDAFERYLGIGATPQQGSAVPA